MAVEEIRHLDKLVFGAGATRCGVTGRIFETGIGSAPKDIQAARFIEEAPDEIRGPWRAAFETLTKAEAEGFKP